LKLHRKQAPRGGQQQKECSLTLRGWGFKQAKAPRRKGTGEEDNQKRKRRVRDTDATPTRQKFGNRTVKNIKTEGKKKFKVARQRGTEGPGRKRKRIAALYHSTPTTTSSKANKGQFNGREGMTGEKTTGEIKELPG